MPLQDSWLQNISNGEQRQLFEGLMNQVASWQYDKAAALNEATPPVEHTITQTGLVDAPSWEHKDETLISQARNFRAQLELYSLTALEPYAYLDQVLDELDAPP